MSPAIARTSSSPGPLSSEAMTDASRAPSGPVSAEASGGSRQEGRLGGGAQECGPGVHLGQPVTAGPPAADTANDTGTGRPSTGTGPARNR
ncbi:hypothetical protein SBADM41S_04889 [Streptomyces badius]